ncbi:hypothetical protein, partial [Vibrio crassostreae]|uniref:hypothetical protein n=1 Tax=Vibrio crassostreae TaxID=246167 RepID=UPI001B317D0F
IKNDKGAVTPVLIFGAGYSPSAKDGLSLGASDTKGRGGFIVNAESGKLMHHFGPTSQLSGILDSIPSRIAVLDGNGDGITDRIYATDTGGNVWR